MNCRVFLCVMTILLAGCQDQGTPLPDWSAPCDKWKSIGVTDYTIDQTVVCFCVNGGVPMRVVVRAGAIQSVTRRSDSTQLTPQEARLYLSVDSLFAIIRNPESQTLAVTYNPTYGNPERLDVDPQLHPVDGGVLYLTSNLRIP